MIVGDASTGDDEQYGHFFSGYAGKELDRMLHESGMGRSEAFVTCVSRERPYADNVASLVARSKKEVTHAHTQLREKYVTRPVLEGVALLKTELQMVKPEIVLALGDLSLWALTGIWSVRKWRGSMLYTNSDIPGKFRVIPTYHPGAVLRQWELRAITVNDFRRAGRFRDGRGYPDPGWRFTVRPSLEKVSEVCGMLLTKLTREPVVISFDLETKHGHIDCAGLAWNRQDALCIPFLSWSNPDGYWSEPEEAYIVYYLFRILTHPNAKVVGQNLLYDSQYTYRHWHFIPRISQDTMISWHVAFPAMRKSLDFQASMLCDYYKQWKPDKSAWKEGG
jgi:uracil-DNA glycosylase